MSFSAVNGADSFSFKRRQLHHSWHSDEAISPVNGGTGTMKESDSEEELSQLPDTDSVPSDDEVIVYSTTRDCT